MLPNMALNNPADVDVVRSVACRDLFEREVGIRAQPANGPDVGFGKASRAVPAPRRTGAVARFVGVVLGDSRPAEISGAVVVAITVPVRDNMLLRRSCSVERRTYSDMHRHCVLLAQSNLEVVALSGLTENGAWERVFPSDAVNEGPVYGSDAATARRLISWMSRDCAPFFSFSDHAAVVRQGAA